MVDNDNIDKLKILYLMDRMEVALSEDIIISICYQDNPWMTYMSCKSALGQLNDANFLHVSRQNGKVFYNITAEGRLCIANFYTKIPSSTREQIVDVVNKKKYEYRKRQELDADYFLNADGTYTVKLSISDPSSSNKLLEFKIVAGNKDSARYAANTWQDKATSIYEYLYEHIFD
ncbi:MAG: DUF4364 family protein [Clostridia bacterium]|nr:DUF4364 family protein [Clostridia bacterium]